MHERRFHTNLAVNHFHFIFSGRSNKHLKIYPKILKLLHKPSLLSLNILCTIMTWLLPLHVVSVVSFVLQLCNKVIFLMSFVGNRGTFTRGYLAMIMDVEFLYHLLYLIICSLGVFVHVFFYSLLVCQHTQNI